MASHEWSRSEAEATVQDYLDMLSCELRREPFNKAAHNRALREMLDGRSRVAVERKHQNISAVLIGFGFPSIDGYKPLRNVQGLLRDIVRERLAVVENLVKADVEEPQAPVVVDDLLGIQVDPPRPTDSEVRQRRLEYGIPGSPRGSIDYLRQETLNRSLGDAGEALVMDYERVRLESAGKHHLARNIEQVSRTVGDHAGYDIRSYECNGRDRFIEVKTTRYGQHTPFYISAGELRFSNVNAGFHGGTPPPTGEMPALPHASAVGEASPAEGSYHLYRLFGFRRMPRLFTLPGDVERHVRLQPMSYRAHL